MPYVFCIFVFSWQWQTTGKGATCPLIPPSPPPPKKRGDTIHEQIISCDNYSACKLNEKNIASMNCLPVSLLILRDFLDTELNLLIKIYFMHKSIVDLISNTSTALHYWNIIVIILPPGKFDNPARERKHKMALLWVGGCRKVIWMIEFLNP